MPDNQEQFDKLKTIAYLEAKTKQEEGLRQVFREAYTGDPSPNDPVYQPAHYKAGGIETLDFIRAKLGPVGFYSYCRGNVLKYVARASFKGNELEDLEKARYYLTRAIETFKETNRVVRPAGGEQDSSDPSRGLLPHQRRPLSP